MNPLSANGSILRFVWCMFLAVIVTVAAAAQTTGQGFLPVKIDPPEATLYVGETLTFTAVAGGAKNAGIRWSIQEPDGGRITDEGIYTAPRTIGVYHIIASSKTDPRAKATATATVVVHYDVPQPQ